MSIGKEVLIIKSRIAEMKKRTREIDLRADSYISLLRDIIDPYGGEWTDFDMDRALVVMNDFHALWKEALNIKAQISKLERELNG